MHTILVFCFNHKKYISQCLRSIINQKDIDSFEIIVVDDDSEDNSVESINEVLMGVKNSKVICNPYNLGFVKNYKNGFSLCTGDLIFILEGDDYWSCPDKISRISKIMMDDPEASLCFHDYHILDHKNVIRDRIVNTNISERKYIYTEDLINDSSIIGNYSVCCYRKELIKKIPDSFWENDTNDWGLNMLMSTFGPIRYYEEKMSVYRLHDESLWTGSSVDKKYQYLLNIIPYYRNLLGAQYNKNFDELTIKINNLKEGITGKNKYFIQLKKYLKKIIS